MGFPRWEAAGSHCSGGATPGSLALMRWFVEEYHSKGGYNLGIYNCRSVRGSSSPSMHGEGRADDLGFPVGDPDGDALLKRLLPNVGKLGIQCIIYERVIYSALSPSGRPYKGAVPHTDHLHVELTHEAAKTLTYKTVKTVMDQAKAKVVHLPGSRILKAGMTGKDVKFLQGKLGVAADGSFGPKTAAAVQLWKDVHRKKYPKLTHSKDVGKFMWHILGVKATY